MELFMKHPIDVQTKLFLNLIDTAKNTEWGRRYDYKSIKNYQDYKNRVPLQDYGSLKDQIIRIKHGEQNVLWPSDIKWFAKSSGTSTGKSKFIPVSKESLIDCHYKGGKDLLSIYHNNHPESKLILGKVLVLGGSSAINPFSNKSCYGDLSAIIMKNFPIWVEHRRVPKMDIAIMDDWEAKIEKMAVSTTQENVSNISGVPSWTLVLMKRILELNKTDNILDIWPNLELFMHGGINFSPYKEQFKKLAPGNQLNYYENYNAIEVGRTKNIPIDYDGIMGVPITFLDKYSPDQFEIIMLANGNARSNVASETLSEVKYRRHPEDKGGVGIINGRRAYARIMIRRKSL